MRLLVTLGVLVLAAAVGAPAEAAPRQDQCALGHRGIDDAHAKKPLPCTTCHRGDATATDAKQAHAGMWANSSDLRVAVETYAPYKVPAGAATNAGGAPR